MKTGFGLRVSGLLLLLGILGTPNLVYGQATIPGEATNFVQTFNGRTGAVLPAEADYTLTLLGDVTITSPQLDDCLRYNGTIWVNSATCGGGGGGGISSLGGLTGSTQLFAVGTSGSDFAISSVTSTHTFNLPTASASNRGALSSSDWSTFNAKQAGDTDLTAVAGLSGTGIVVRSGTAAYVLRTIVGGSSKLSVSNGDGVSANPSIDAVPANFLLQDLGGLAIKAQLPSAIAYEDEANSFSAAQTILNQNELRLGELTSNGIHYLGFKALASVAANFTLIWAVESDCTGNTNGGALTVNSSLEIRCSDDDGGGGGGGDSVSVNGSAADGANLINTTASGSVPSVTWALATGSDPDTIQVSAIGPASATEAGIVNVSAQTFAGQKTFGSGALFIDSVTKFYDDADPTKLLRFQLSTIGAGQERVVSFPDASGEASLLGQTIGDNELVENYGGVGACTGEDFVSATVDAAGPTCSALPSRLAYENEANSFTELQLIDPGTTPEVALRLSIAQPGGAGTRDSHSFEIIGTSFDTAGHDAKWQAFVDVTSNAGASTFHIQSQIDSAGYATRLSLTDAGVLNVTGLLLGGAATANSVLACDGTVCGLTVLAKAHLPAAIAYEDETNTFSALQTLSVGALLTPMALPGTPGTGRVVIDSGDTNSLKWYDGSGWLEATPCTRSLAGGSGVGTIGDLCADRTINLDFASESENDTPDALDWVLTEVAASAGTFQKTAIQDLLTGGSGISTSGRSIDWEPSELGSIVISGGGTASLTFGWSLSGATDPQFTIANNLVTLNVPLNVPELQVDGGGTGSVSILEGTAPGAGGSAGEHNVYFLNTDSRLYHHENGGSATPFLEPSSTDTLLNKTYDAEGTGNVLTAPGKVLMGFVGCNGTTGTILWDTLATLAPTPTCSAGPTNITKMRGTLDFPDSDGDYSVQRQDILLPEDWVGDIGIRFIWQAAATSGDVVWQVQTSCIDDAEVNDAAWNTASTVTDPAKGTTLQTNQASMTGLDVTGCTAADILHLRVLRNRTHASDSITGVVSLIDSHLTIRRAM
jgi:hypothetical protein